MSFDKDAVIERLIGVEGKYSNHPSDPGGETMWGITVGEARDNGYTGQMKTMPRELAKQIYYNKYLVKPGILLVSEVNGDIAEELFDTGVNMGTSIPGLFLQRALNVLNVQGTLYPDLLVDGSIGPATIRALKAYLSKRGQEGISVILTMLNVLQGYRYIEIAERKETSEDFMFGWYRARVLIRGG